MKTFFKLEIRTVVLMIFVVVVISFFSSCLAMIMKASQPDYPFDNRHVSFAKFSVGNEKTVHFVEGNLWGFKWDPKDRSKKRGVAYYGTGWNFGRMGGAGGETDGWGVSDAVSGRYGYGECDSVTMYVGDSLFGGYRLLTAEEWEYLLFKRNCSTIGGVENARFVHCNVNFTEGLIIFPDNYKHPRKCTEVFGANDVSGFSLDNRFSMEEWYKMREQGAIFLIEPHHNSFYPNGYLTSSKSADGEIAFLCFSSYDRFVEIRWVKDGCGVYAKGLARLVVDD